MVSEGVKYIALLSSCGEMRVPERITNDNRINMISHNYGYLLLFVRTDFFFPPTTHPDVNPGVGWGGRDLLFTRGAQNI